jgi:riboflavin synthase
MRIGFVDCATNKADAFEAFSAITGEMVAGAQVERRTAPDLLKIPLTAKKLLAGGCDTAVVFLMLSEDELDAMSLVHEKIIDVELLTEKYVLFCIVSDEEYESDAEFEKVAESRMRTVLRLASQLELSPSQVSEIIGDAQMTQALAELSGFSAAVQQDGAQAGGEEQVQMPGTEGEGGAKSLF